MGVRREIMVVLASFALWGCAPSETSMHAQADREAVEQPQEGLEPPVNMKFRCMQIVRIAALYMDPLPGTESGLALCDRMIELSEQWYQGRSRFLNDDRVADRAKYKLSFYGWIDALRTESVAALSSWLYPLTRLIAHEFAWNWLLEHARPRWPLGAEIDLAIHISPEPIGMSRQLRPYVVWSDRHERVYPAPDPDQESDPIGKTGYAFFWQRDLERYPPCVERIVNRASYSPQVGGNDSHVDELPSTDGALSFVRDLRIFDKLYACTEGDKAFVAPRIVIPNLSSVSAIVSLIDSTTAGDEPSYQQDTKRLVEARRMLDGYSWGEEINEFTFLGPARATFMLRNLDENSMLLRSSVGTLFTVDSETSNRVQVTTDGRDQPLTLTASDPRNARGFRSQVFVSAHEGDPDTEVNLAWLSARQLWLIQLITAIRAKDDPWFPYSEYTLDYLASYVREYQDSQGAKVNRSGSGEERFDDGPGFDFPWLDP